MAEVAPEIVVAAVESQRAAVVEDVAGAVVADVADPDDDERNLSRICAEFLLRHLLARFQTRAGVSFYCYHVIKTLSNQKSNKKNRANDSRV